MGVDGHGDEEEDGLEDGLDSLMDGDSDNGGKKQVGMSRWRGVLDENGGVVDRDSDWTRSKGISIGRGRVHRQYSDSEEEAGDGNDLEKDDLKWPAGEGWKPL